MSSLFRRFRQGAPTTGGNRPAIDAELEAKYREAVGLGGGDGELYAAAENQRDDARDQLAEARSWARHGYEIGQRHCGWTDHGVAPAWLTEGWPPHIDNCQHLTELAEVREERLKYGTECNRLSRELEATHERARTLVRRLKDVKAERDTARAQVVAVRALAADMRTWCSPHNIADHYADSIELALDGQIDERQQITALVQLIRDAKYRLAVLDPDRCPADCAEGHTYRAPCSSAYPAHGEQYAGDDGPATGLTGGTITIPSGVGTPGVLADPDHEPQPSTTPLAHKSRAWEDDNGEWNVSCTDCPESAQDMGSEHDCEQWAEDHKKAATGTEGV